MKGNPHTTKKKCNSMGNVSSWCQEMWIGDKIYDLRVLVNDATSLYTKKERATKMNITKYLACKESGNKQGEELYRALATSLAEEARVLVNVIVVTSRLKGRLEQMQLSVRMTDEVSATKSLLDQCVRYVETGTITKAQLDCLMETLRDDELSLFADENLEKTTVDFDTLVAEVQLAKMPSAPIKPVEVRDDMSRAMVDF